MLVVHKIRTGRLAFDSAKEFRNCADRINYGSKQEVVPIKN